MEQIYIDPTSFVNTSKGLIRGEWLTSNLIVKNINGAIQRILFVEKESVTVKELLLKNGNKISFFINNYVDTVDGFKKIDLVKEQELIKHSVFSSFNPKIEIKTNWENIFKGSSLKVKVPQYLNKDFAFWIGLVCSHAKFGANDMAFEIKEGKEQSGEIFKELTKKIFDLTPLKIVDKQGRTYYSVASKNLMKFLQVNIGKNRLFRKVPKFIQESSVDDQIKFIEGLSLKGNDKDKLIIFSGTSKILTDYVSSFLISIGYQVYIKNNLSGNGKKVLYVQVVSKHKLAKEIKSPFINLESLSTRYLVKVPELINFVKIKKNNHSYKGYKNLVKNQAKTCSSHILENADLVYDDLSYFVEVKEVKIVQKEMMKIFCYNQEGIISEGILLKN